MACAFEIGSGVRMPATTSSPCAFGRYSPKKRCSPVDGIAREGDAGGAVVAHVAEDHRLHVDRGAPVVGDLIQLAVGDGALVVPGVEHRADRAPELLAARPAESRCRVFSRTMPLYVSTSSAQSVGRNLGVGLHARLVAQREELVLEVLLVDLQHDVGVHLDEAAIRVECETLVARRLRQPCTVSSFSPRLRIVSIMPGIEARAPERTETSSGFVAIAELAADRFLDAREVLGDGVLQFGRIRLVVRRKSTCRRRSRS